MYVQLRFFKCIEGTRFVSYCTCQSEYSSLALSCFVSSVQDVNIVSCHASGKCVFVRTISDLCELFIANQMVSHITIKGVIVHTGFSSDEVGDCLGMLACDN